MSASSSRDPLDDVFGRLVDPATVQTWEGGRSPVSLFWLADPARRFAEWARLALDEARYTLPLHADIPFLWIIDARGELWLALEEVVDEVSGQFQYVRRKLANVPAHLVKCGHPALLRGGAGRIAGELYIDDGDPTAPCWVINKHSGRYSRGHSDRDERTLDNVKALFSRHGVDVQVDPT